MRFQFFEIADLNILNNDLIVNFFLFHPLKNILLETNKLKQAPGDAQIIKLIHYLK